jgi:hypothetical protein
MLLRNAIANYGPTSVKNFSVFNKDIIINLIVIKIENNFV